MAHDVEEAIPAADATIKRRGILAAAGVAVASIVAKQATQPVAAAATMQYASVDGEIVENQAHGITKITSFDPFTSTYPVFVGQVFQGSANCGVQETVGIRGNTPFLCGVYGDGNQVGAMGVYARAIGGTAIRADGGGATGIGVQGQSDASGAIGVIGASSAGVGVKGAATTGFPIIGQIVGPTNINAGVLGTGTTGPGVQGQSTAGHGLVGTTFSTDGNHAGLIGTVQPGGNAIGLRGSVPGGATGFAGVFDGNVHINGGVLSAPAVRTVAMHAGDGTHRLLQTIASPEGWFEDFGRGTLAGGKAEVKLDADFAALIHADNYHVFLTARGPVHLHVSQQNTAGFTVIGTPLATAGGGLMRTEVAATTFAYRVVARRKDITGERLAQVAPPPALKPIVPFTVHETPITKPPVSPTRAKAGNPSELE